MGREGWRGRKLSGAGRAYYEIMGYKRKCEGVSSTASMAKALGSPLSGLMVRNLKLVTGKDPSCSCTMSQSDVSANCHPSHIRLSMGVFLYLDRPAVEGVPIEQAAGAGAGACS
jgi:hypothetical protein